MSNRIKGEIDIDVKDGPLAGTFILLLDLNALCELEDDFPGIMNGTAKIEGLKSIRRIFHVGFQRHHPDLSEIEAGDIVHAIGIGEAAKKMGESLKAAFPTAEQGKPKGSPRRGPEKRGTGTEA